MEEEEEKKEEEEKEEEKKKKLFGDITPLQRAQKIRQRKGEKIERKRRARERGKKERKKIISANENSQYLPWSGKQFIQCSVHISVVLILLYGTGRLRLQAGSREAQLETSSLVQQNTGISQSHL